MSGASLPTQHTVRAQAYELLFTSLFNPGKGFAFPCDVQGHADIDSLGSWPAITTFVPVRRLAGISALL
jgi:hypothetical protein